MSKPISAGDLVVVVKPTECCGSPTNIGRFFTVTGYAISEWGYMQCVACHGRREVLPSDVVLDDGTGCMVHRLKRVPPLDELESENQKEDIREPA